jgi:hypothetical protein
VCRWQVCAGNLLPWLLECHAHWTHLLFPAQRAQQACGVGAAANTDTSKPVRTEQIQTAPQHKRRQLEDLAWHTLMLQLAVGEGRVPANTNPHSAQSQISLEITTKQMRGSFVLLT